MVNGVSVNTYNQFDVFGFGAPLTKRQGASFIQETEISRQHRDYTFIEAGKSERHYLGAAQVDEHARLPSGHAAFGLTLECRSHLSHEHEHEHERPEGKPRSRL